MVARRNDVDVYRLASGHSPFLSQVDALADGLVDYARDVLVKSGREAA